MRSQNSEDLMLAGILSLLPPMRRYCVEIGVGYSGTDMEYNCWRLLEEGWDGLLIDAEPFPHPKAKQAFVTAENFAAILESSNVPHDLGILSLDVDGNDYWLWKHLDPQFVPSIVVMEYNVQIPAMEPLVTPYSPDFRWDGTRYFGASATAILELGRIKGYRCVASTARVNLFFVREELVDGRLPAISASDLVGPPSREHRIDELERSYVTVEGPI